jgi:glycosyltransferase involved in cell wall biosynthesis
VYTAGNEAEAKSMSNEKILLSVIIPLLNASEDVEGVFKSIVAQTGVDKKTIEIIVVNDGSSDDTEEKVEEHRRLFDDFSGFRVIEHKNRIGLAQSRYDGARAATGRFLTFIDKKLRPDTDYLASLLSKKYNFVIGNVYMDKTRSPWDRMLVLIRKKLYFPYFNHPFDDIKLDQKTYSSFKNKGGGGVMLVMRSHYLEVTGSIKKSKHISDDSLIIVKLLELEPLLKTASAKALYLNRTGFNDNLRHLYERGPKFVDYYTKPGTRFFPAIIAFIFLLLADIVLAFFAPIVLQYELLTAILLLILLSIYLAEEPLDFVTCLWLFPIIFVAFASGILKGLVMKILRLY